MTKRPFILPLGITLAFVMWMAGCGGQSEPRAAVVSDSTLVEILIDLHLADARARLPSEVPGRMRDSILANHGLDSAAFSQIMAVYIDQPENLIALYNSVLDRMNADRLSFPATPVR